MGSIEPIPGRVEEWLNAAEDDTPIVMINLLRYREHAGYPAGSSAPACSGREAYLRYGAGVGALLAKAGARPVWLGAVSSSLIAPEGETWDDAVLVEYPSRRAFSEMISSAEYREVAVHRSAALEDSRLIATRPGAISFAR